jgi:hypothetical protein
LIPNEDRISPLMAARISLTMLSKPPPGFATPHFWNQRWRAPKTCSPTARPGSSSGRQLQIRDREELSVRHGTKRTGFSAAVPFLELNGYRLEAGEADATIHTLALAAGELGEAEYAAWMQVNSGRRSSRRR